MTAVNSFNLGLQQQLAQTKERLLGYPPRLREVRVRLAGCQAALKPLRGRVAEREAEIRAEVQMEPVGAAGDGAGGVVGKLRYTNDAARNAEVKARLPKDADYASASTRLATAELALGQAEIDLQGVEDERAALKYYLDATIAEVQLATFHDPAS